MLIVCSGEDSYRALEKARELEEAFKQKYDPTGSAVTRLLAGKEGTEVLLVAATGGSLFSLRSFFRVDGLISGCPKNRIDALVSTLSRDVENTIIVSLEEGVLSEKMLKPYASIQKFIHYTFSTLSPAAFITWATNYAKKQGVSDVSSIKKLADSSGGESWVFVNELQKWKAGGALAERERAAPSVYDVIDQLMMGRANRWSSARAFDDADAVVAMGVGQARSLLMVRSGKGSVVHPFVAQKLSRLSVGDPDDVYRRLAAMLVMSRTGKASAEEVLDVWG